MKIKYLRICKAWLMVLVFLFSGAVNAQAAGYSFLDGKLSVAGLVRHQVVVNMGHINPYNSTAPNMLGVQEDKNSINLSRTLAVLELDYRPSDDYRVFTKLRGIWDQTTLLDSDLHEYKALTLSTDHYGTSMRAGHDDNIIAEIWELYGEAEVGNLWFRLGRQQIVWGEMISARILDVVNPLDTSWHNVFEPEEYENIRIPLWMARAIYTFDRPLIPGVDDLSIEAFYNPGDIVPNNVSEAGNVYNPTPSPGEDKAWEEDRRGDDEFGIKIGGRIGQVGFALHYAYLYTDSGYEKQDFYFPGPGPPTITGDYVYYPQIDMYGLALNYAFDFPISIAAALEIAHYPDMPWQTVDDLKDYFPAINFKTVTQTDCAIKLSRFCRVFPNLPQMMNVNLQYQVRFVEDADSLKVTTGPSGIDSGPFAPPMRSYGNTTESEYNDAFALSVSQTWNHNTYKAACTTLWQPDGGYSINPSITWSPGDHWRVYASLRWWGGSAFDNATKGWLSYFHYQDEAMFRVEYQF